MSTASHRAAQPLVCAQCKRVCAGIVFHNASGRDFCCREHWYQYDAAHPTEVLEEIDNRYCLGCDRKGENPYHNQWREGLAVGAFVCKRCDEEFFQPPRIRSERKYSEVTT